MLIFNGKTYFVPFIGSDKVAGADATPDQVVEGVKFVGANGVVESGSLKRYESAIAAGIFTEDRENAYFRSNVDEPIVVEDYIDARVPLAIFGDALPSQVVEGVKFTSAEGVAEEGTLPVYSPDNGPIICYPIGANVDPYGFLFTTEKISSFVVEDIIDFSVSKSKFGDATAADVRQGKRFTSAEGLNEEGTMPTIALPEATIHFDVDSGRILSVVTNNEDGFVEKGETSAYTYLRTQKAAVIEPSNTTQIAVQKNYWTTGDVTVAPIPDYYIDASDMSVFGNATAADVRKGKRFTSADGVNEEGTMPVFGDTLIRLSLTDKCVTLDNGYHSDTTVEILTEKEKEVTPTKEGVTVSPKTGRVLSTVKVKGDNNLIPENIAEGVSIFGITGTHKGGSEIKTCKLTVTRSTTTGQTMTTATTFDGTNFVPVTLRSYSGTDTIENVVCGSVVQIQTIYMTSLYGWTYGKDEMGYGGAINIPYDTGDYTVEIGSLDD